MDPQTELSTSESGEKLEEPISLEQLCEIAMKLPPERRKLEWVGVFPAKPEPMSEEQKQGYAAYRAKNPPKLATTEELDSEE